MPAITGIITIQKWSIVQKAFNSFLIVPPMDRVLTKISVIRLKQFHKPIYGLYVQKTKNAKSC